MATDTSKAIKRTAPPMTPKDIRQQKKIDMAMSKGAPIKNNKKK